MKLHSQSDKYVRDVIIRMEVQSAKLSYWSSKLSCIRLHSTLTQLHKTPTSPVNGWLTQHVVESKCPFTSNFGTFAFWCKSSQKQHIMNELTCKILHRNAPLTIDNQSINPSLNYSNPIYLILKQEKLIFYKATPFNILQSLLLDSDKFIC